MLNEHDKKLLEMFWDKEHEEMLEKEFSNNEELRKVFEKHPDRKDMYKLKIIDSEVVHYPSPPDDVCCKTCIFRLRPMILEGKEVPRHSWGKCHIYDNKPHDVLWDKAECEYYEEQKLRPE